MKEQDKKLGPIPEPLNDLQQQKLRLGIKVGIFYFQYTLLKQSLANRNQEMLHAPRGYAKHLENEPVDPEHAKMQVQFDKLNKHDQP